MMHNYAYLCKWTQEKKIIYLDSSNLWESNDSLRAVKIFSLISIEFHKSMDHFPGSRDTGAKSSNGHGA